MTKEIKSILNKYGTKYLTISHDNAEGGSRLNDWAGVEFDKAERKAAQALLDHLLSLPELSDTSQLNNKAVEAIINMLKRELGTESHD